MSEDRSKQAILIGRARAGAGAGAGWRDETLALVLANRHGLVTGATGTGKTVTLQVLAEGFSRAGVPVFAADVKGDLSGIAAPGEAKPFLLERARTLGLTYRPERFPVAFWDLFGEQGHPVRTTVSEMGPMLLARLLGLNPTQEGVLNIVFRVADEQGLLLLDLKDLRAMLTHVAEQAGTLTRQYGNVSSASVGAILRALLVLENEGADAFFGEPALAITDLMQVDRSGYGVISVLAADQLMARPRLYACFLLWLLSEMFEQLPEVGDPDKPKLVFFFDEAHLLFNDAPKALLEKVEQVVRLIRSKGVGVYFVTQNPLDVPESVLAQLGNRVQHALRAFTPRDQKAVRAAAETFRPNPALDTAAVITQLGKGEALVSTLEGNGTPSVVQRTLIAPPASRVGPLTAEERQALVKASPLDRAYRVTVDRHSAYEDLQGGAVGGHPPSEPSSEAPSGPWGGPWGGSARTPEAPRPERTGSGIPRTGPRETASAPEGRGRATGGATGRASPRPSTRMSTTERVVGQLATSVAREVGTQLGRAILRGIFGVMKK